MKVYNLEEAREFFLLNHRDSVICVKNGEEKEVNSYLCAKKFFANENFFTFF